MLPKHPGYGKKYILIYYAIQWTSMCRWYTGRRKLWFFSILIGYWWCNGALLSDNCFITVFTGRQMVCESMHGEATKQVAYWFTSCLYQSLLLRRGNKTSVLQGTFIGIIVLEGWRLNLHSKLARLWNILFSLKYWVKSHLLSHGKQFIAHLSLPLPFISHQVVRLSKLVHNSPVPWVISEGYFVISSTIC